MELDQYVWGRHHRALIARRARKCPLDAHRLAEQCGYRNITKFQRHREFWKRGRAHRRALIPRAYLNSIQVDWCELLRAVEQDVRGYYAALKAMPPPENVVTLARLGCVLREPLPNGLSEEELYDHVQRIADAPDSKWGKAVLDWPGMKQVRFHAGRKPTEHLRPPRILLVRECVDFGDGP
jgi:hypothetical protein